MVPDKIWSIKQIFLIVHKTPSQKCISEWCQKNSRPHESQRQKKEISSDVCPNENSNRPAHPHSLIRVFIVCTITNTYLYNFDPLKTHFYIIKLGFIGVYIIYLFLLKTIDCGYSLKPPRRGSSNEYPQSIFWAEIWKISEFIYTERKKKRRVEFFPSYFNHFLRCLLDI